MSYTAIRVEHLGKQYRIGENANKFRENITHLLTKPFQARTAQNEDANLFWPLKDINFEVKAGEIVGIIGHNGAGKSTLLKILSRITSPTTGQIRLRGRVGALLEVGTGFHQELTGRENIYMNGAILGMTRREIDLKFDEIVAFSGIERFIDTPIKRYSSGMEVRLAFAVAAHLEPEILLVDEVLAVGDAEFQRKCLGHMNQTASRGKTVIFVSHNMGAISNLCNRVIWLDRGSIKADGIAEVVIPQYLSHGLHDSGKVQLEVGDEEVAILHEIGILAPDGNYTNHIGTNSAFDVWLRFTIKQPLSSGQVGINVMTPSTGDSIFVSTHTDTLADPYQTLLPGEHEARVTIPAHFMNRGTYLIAANILGAKRGDIRRSHAMAKPAIAFTIEETGSTATRLNDHRGGVVTPLFDWFLAAKEQV